MPDTSVQPLGPLFGPDFILIEVNDQSEGTFALEVFPDAQNPALKANGLPMQFYYMPKNIYLAKKENSNTDFDFSVTLFKGLMTTEDTLGISGLATTGGEVDAGGAFVSFSTKMAVPDSVVKGALANLKSLQPNAIPARIAQHCALGNGGPEPSLGIVPIVDNTVTIEVPQLGGGDAKSPWFISAQGTGHGSIEASGVSSFLVTCNQLAAGAIVGALQAGNSPFTVHYNLTMMFYMNACQIQMHVDVDKTFTQLSGAAEGKAGGFFQADLSANYQSCLTSGAITTVINENEVALPDTSPLKDMINKQCGDMQTKAWDLVKAEIFDWQPKPDAPATASSGACGAAVSLKASYSTHGVKFDQNWTLNDTVTKLDTVSGTLTELQPAIKANLNKYLSIVDIGNFFQKLQIAATPNINFADPTKNSDFADPIVAASVEVSYPVAGPDGTGSLNADGTPTLLTKGEGFHYTPASINQAAPSALARWTKDNPNDIINISFMRLLKSLPNWDANQVIITKKLVYNTDDSRVDLSTGTTEMTIVSTGNDHTPVVGPDDVGYIYCKFVFDRPMPLGMTVTLTITLTGTKGTRTDVVSLDGTDPKAKPFGLWQVWSDKYFDADIAKMKIDVEVAPPPSNPLGASVAWSGNLAVPVGLGRIKRIVPFIIPLPACPDPAQLALASQYILQAQKDALASK